MSRPTVHLEPASYAMTGPECGVAIRMRTDADFDAIGALDAPEYIARGSVSARNPIQPGAVIYASTSDPMRARMFGA
jgi:hypothetical protein